MPPAARTLTALGAVIIAGSLDAATGPPLVFTPMYGFVIALAAWHAGPRSGLLVAVAAAVSRLLSELAWVAPDGAVIGSAVAWTAAFVALARFSGWARALRADTSQLQARVDELIQNEHRSARTDALTSLCNRRAFIDALQQAEARTRRDGRALAVLRIDIDSFSGFNETYSRADGDEFLRALATSLALATRMGDLAARLENDEFAMLLYDCGEADACRVAERIVGEVAALARAYPEARIGANVGIACVETPGPDPDEMMRRAGSALRHARRTGRNAVIVESGHDRQVAERD